MKKIDVLKGVTKFVVSVGVGAIVTNAVNFTTPTLAMGIFKRAAVGVGALVLSCMVADTACKYAEEKIDDAVSEIQKVVKEEELNDSVA